MLINLASSATQQSLTIDNFTPAAAAETWRFDAQHNAEQVETTTLDRPIALPPESMTLLVVPAP
jgi:hypothetical protein